MEDGRIPHDVITAKKQSMEDGPGLQKKEKSSDK